MPNFLGEQPLEKSLTNFFAVRDRRRALPLYFDVDLSTARSKALNNMALYAIAGNSFYIDANPNDGSAIVHFQDQNLDSTAVPYYVSPGFIATVPFTQIAIENTAQVGKKIRIVYGVDVDFQPGSVAQQSISGSIGTIEAVYAKSALAQAFAVQGGNGAIAGQIGYSVLWNPPGSGKYLYCDSVAVNCGTASNVAIQTCTALGNFTLNNTGLNKYLGGPASVAATWSNPAVASTATIGANTFDLIACAAGAYVDLKFNSPFIIPPGFGLAIDPTTANTAFSAYFRYTEN